MDNKKKYEVLNRTSGIVVYTIPDLNIERTFEPMEKKMISYGELEKLQYQPGGMSIMQNCLLISDPTAVAELGVKTEPEYYYTPEEVKILLTTGSLDQLSDCLNFAPTGVIDIIKTMAVELPLNDIAKCKLIEEKLDFNVLQAIENAKDAVITDVPAAKTRKAAPVTSTKSASSKSAAPARTAPPVATNK